MRGLGGSLIVVLTVLGACGRSTKDTQAGPDGKTDVNPTHSPSPTAAMAQTPAEPKPGPEEPLADAAVPPTATPTKPENTKPADTKPETTKPETTTPESGFRYTHRACDLCNKREATTCLDRTHPGGRNEQLGCGTASPLGSYAVVGRETGSSEDETWVLDYIYHGPKGIIWTDEEACTGSPGFYCNGPGRFLKLADGAWMQHMGNAGDGTNDQSIANLLSDKRFALPVGEYDLIEHPAGRLAGLLSAEPNIYDDQGQAHIKITLGCFDTQTRTTHILWTRQEPEESGDSYSIAELTWNDKTLEVRSDGKLLGHGRCPPTP